MVLTLPEVFTTRQESGVNASGQCEIRLGYWDANIFDKYICVAGGPKIQLSRGNIHAYAIRGGNEVYGIISAMDALR